MSNIDKRELLGVQKHANQHRLSRLTMEVHTDELRIMASAVESYTDELIAALEAAEKRIAELEARAVVVNIKPPVIGRAYSALNRVWTEQEVHKACELAGIKLHIAAGIGKGE